MRLQLRYLTLFICLVSKALCADYYLSIHDKPKYNRTFDHFEYTNPDAPESGTLTLHAMNHYDSFNPFILKGVAPAGIERTYDTLMVAALDEPKTYYGLIANDISVSDDSITFSLNPNAQFHDRHPITPEDVVYTFNLLKEKGRPVYASLYQDITHTTTHNNTVTFHLKTPHNQELPFLLAELPVLPKHYWSNRAFDKDVITPPLGSGPYQISDYQMGQNITYTRVPHYWGKHLNVRKGFNNFNQIKYLYYLDPKLSLYQFLSHEYDYREEYNSKEWAIGYDKPKIQPHMIQKESLRHQEPQGMQAFVFNLRKPIFQNIAVREAISLAFDFNWVNKHLFYNQYVRNTSFFSNSILASDDIPLDEELKALITYRNTLKTRLFHEPFSLSMTAGDGNNHAALVKANQLLDDAGLTMKNGHRLFEGKPMTFNILLISPGFERVVVPFIQELKQLGIEATYRIVDQSQYIQRVQNFDYDMIVTTLMSTHNPGSELALYWHSKHKDQSGLPSYVGLNDPAIDSIIERIMNTPSIEEKKPLVKALDRMLLWGHYVIPHWHLNYRRLAFWYPLTHTDYIPPYGHDVMTWWRQPGASK
ncbi:MAG: extracellular solute-binding protein [Candidatus Comchoanobacterales bacterium]